MTEKKNNTYLEVNNLSKSFGNFEAIKNIGIDIKEGEFVCFLGPSGCGKTTLLRCIAGLETQTAGSVIQKNTDISNEPPSNSIVALHSVRFRRTAATKVAQAPVPQACVIPTPRSHTRRRI